MKIKLIFLLNLYFMLQAQVPHFNWLKDVGPDGIAAREIAAGTKGDVYCSFTLDNPNWQKIQRYDSSGLLLWSLPGDYLSNVVTCPNNNVLLYGSIHNTLTFGATTITPQPGNGNAAIVRLDENGNLLNHVLVKKYYSGFFKVKVNPAGEIYILGMVHDTINFNGHLITTTLTPNEYYRLFMLKLDQNLTPCGRSCLIPAFIRHLATSCWTVNPIFTLLALFLIL